MYICEDHSSCLVWVVLIKEKPIARECHYSTICQYSTYSVHLTFWYHTGQSAFLFKWQSLLWTNQAPSTKLGRKEDNGPVKNCDLHNIYQHWDKVMDLLQITPCHKLLVLISTSNLSVLICYKSLVDLWLNKIKYKAFYCLWTKLIKKI